MFAQTKIIAHTIFVLLIVSAFLFFVHLSSEDAEAISTCTWKQTSGNLASTDANWDTGLAPTPSDNVVFDETSSADCQWNYPVSLGSFSIDAGFGGSIDMNADVFITKPLVIASSHVLTITGPWTVTLNTYWGGGLSNAGTIAGTGIFRLLFYSADVSWALGNISSSLTFLGHGAAPSDRTFILTNDLLVGGNLLVEGGSYHMILDARTCYIGAVGTITIGTLGAIQYATFNITSSPGFGGGVQTEHSYNYEVDLNTSAIPADEAYILTTNATWLHWDATDLAVYGTPDTVFGGHWYFVNISVTDGMLSDYQNYTILVIDIETAQDYAPLILGLAFGFGLIAMSYIDRKKMIWATFAGLAWFVISIVAFYPVGMAWMLLGIGIGLIMWIEGTMEYAAGRKGT